MRAKLISLSSLLAVAIVLLLAMAGPNVLAQTGGNITNEGATSKQRSGDSMKISPLRSDITVRPGETKKVTVYIQNITQSAVTLKPINNDFIAGSKEDGSPAIILNEGEFAPTHSLKRFMQPLPNITVGPGERKAVDVTIVVPANAKSGGYFGAIRFAPALADGGASISVSGSVTSLILLTVPGNLIENLQLNNFDIRQHKKVVGRLSSANDVDVLIRLENKGNVQVAPFGEVYVQKNGKIIQASKINAIKPPGVILPDSKRKWVIPIKSLNNFGKYNISATIGYGNNGETIEVKKDIWVIPTAYIVGGIAGLIVLLGFIAVIFTALRSYKRRILRGARRQR